MRVAKVDGTSSGMNIRVSTDLRGKDIPEGNYQAEMFTDYIHQLNISKFTGQVMQGQVQATGLVNWQHAVRWEAQGHMQGMQPKDKLVPASIRDFLYPL